MIHSDVKLVATDLDGTLLGPAIEVSARTIAAVRAAAGAGIEVVAVTGRSHRSAVPLLRHIEAIRWIICSNGAAVYDQVLGAVVQHVPLPAEMVAAAIETITGKFRRVGFAWETLDGLFHSSTWVEVRRRTQSENHFSPSYSTPVDQSAPTGGDVLKLLVAHDTLVGHEWLEALAPHIPFGATAATSGTSFVEITEGGANKGAALARLCQGLGVDRSATVAFGDNGNDIDMLRWAGRGYAMANAHPSALAAADVVAPHHGLDGVAQVLEALVRPHSEVTGA